MVVDQHAISQLPDPSELIRMLATASRELLVRTCGRAAFVVRILAAW